ncbi:hypothetical protein QWY28_23050, partial [Nocardioides sp. SOB77]|nr:hypothetical protein [Nocardioides oceani]
MARLTPLDENVDIGVVSAVVATVEPAIRNTPARGRRATMYDHDRQFPRAYTVPGTPHKAASALGVKWALEQAESLGSVVSVYAPGKQNLHHVAQDHPTVHGLIQSGVRVTTWRDSGPGAGVIVALWPDETHLLVADENSSTTALVAITWSPRPTLAWAQAKGAAALGGPRPDISLTRPLDPVVAEAVVVPPESWRASLCGFPVGGRCVLVVDRAHHARRAVPAFVVV